MTRHSHIKKWKLAPSEYAKPPEPSGQVQFWPSSPINNKITGNSTDVCNDNDINEPKKVYDKLHTSGDNDTVNTRENGNQSECDKEGNQDEQNSLHIENGNEDLENENDPEQEEPSGSPLPQETGPDYNIINEIETYMKRLINITRIRLMLVGHYKAGKTSLRDTLLGKPFRDTGRTEGIDVTTCSVDVTSSENWQEVSDDVFGFYEEVEALKAQIMLPDPENSGATSGYGSAESEIYESLQQHPEIKIWDMGGEFGYYCSHQMFLDSECIYLLVMDASKDVEKMLDAEIPLSHATEAQSENIHCPRKMIDFLDYWLDNISTFINPGLSKEEQASIAIVLTHTDKLGPDSEQIISRYKEMIEAHIENKYASRFVYHHIFAVSNKERCEETFDELRRTIFEMAEKKVELSKDIPFLWMVIEAEIRKYSESTNRKCFTLNDIKSQVLDERDLPLDECKEFLQSQHSVRRMIFIEAPDQMHDDEFDALVITDPQYVVDVFRSVIALWHGLSTNTLATSLYQKMEIRNNIKENCVSLRHLQQVWTNCIADNITVAHLAWMLYAFNQIFMSKSAHRDIVLALKYQDLETKFTVPVLLPPSPREVPDTSASSFKLPLIYYFYLANSALTDNFINSTSFLPVGFLPILASRLSNCVIDNQLWKQEKLYFDTAEFTTGKYHDFHLALSTHRNVIFVNIFPAIHAEYICTMGCVVNFIRTQIERCISDVVNEMCPQLKCGVCISPCYSRDSTIRPSHNQHIHNHEIRTDCLKMLGSVQEDADEQIRLKLPKCQEHNIELPKKSYICWFCSNETNANTHPDKVLLRISEKVPTEFIMIKLFSELGIPSHTISQCFTDKHGEISLTTFHLLRKWLDSKDGGFSHGSGAWSELTNALEKAGLPRPNQIMAEA